MELRYENGNPSKEWVVTMPKDGMKVDGPILITLVKRGPAKVKAKYSGRTVVLTFNRVADGKAVVNVSEGKRPLLGGPAAVIME